MATLQKIRAAQVKEGDQYGTSDSGWVALTDAVVGDRTVTFEVEFLPDRSVGAREFDLASDISVFRP